jgi:ferredoxin-NADP reductase
MSEHIVKVIHAEYINHNVKQFTVEKPQGYEFISGQATDVSINLPGWKDRLSPFTFTSLNDWEHLEFTTKIYTDHDGVTNQLGKINAGDELILHDVFGVIQYKGEGVFIAGGAGVTPFISILRSLYVQKKIRSNELIFSNKTSEDVFLDDEFTKMLGNNYHKVYTRENVIGFTSSRIDRDYLTETVKDFSRHFYVCGPDEFVSNITALLMELGAAADTVVFEK